MLFLDSNTHQMPYGNWEAVLAVGAVKVLEANPHQNWSVLQAHVESTQDWLFGYLGYDLKNELENLQSENTDAIQFPDMFFFQPQKLIYIQGSKVVFSYVDAVAQEIAQDYVQIAQFPAEKPVVASPVAMQARVSKATYLQNLSHLLQHIHRGDIYEINYCQEFYAKATIASPPHLFRKLNKISKPPFAAYLQHHSLYACCASPERFLQKRGDLLRSQPIKGTAKRYSHPKEDALAKQQLATDIKERAENIMIVDLVRNDLSRVAQRASVAVPELCAVKSYQQVHQMESTVTAKLHENYSGLDALKACFPMGSMTGAPKIAAMQIIEQYELSKRSLYSGAIGYFTPEGDFDFNVVIRSILYNQDRNYVSYSVGGAITAQSDPEKEYQECLIKAEAMRQVLEDL